jgi:nitroreductase
MEFRELVQQRSSVRHFRPDAVPVDDIREMVRVAGLAPSPNNSQPWRFIAVTNKVLLGRMAETVRAKVQTMAPESASDDIRRARQRVEWFSTFFADAPLTMAIVSLPYEAVIQGAIEGPTPTAAQINAMRGQPDIQCLGAAVEHLLLAAADMGYGGCWLSSPLVAREALEAALGIAAPARLGAMVAIGKPSGTHAPVHDRKALDDILTIIE